MRPDRWRGRALLAAAIASEVLGTMALPASAGFTRPGAAAVVLAGYVTSILLFSRALRHGLSLGIAYGTLTGCGLAAATVLGTGLLGEPLDARQAIGLALILVGALVLQRDPPAPAAP